MLKSKLIGLRIDIETKSRVSIDNGVYPYAECPDFEVLHVAYSPMREFSDGVVKLGHPRLLDLGAPDRTAKFSALLTNPRFQKHAFNAAFERVCLSKWVGLPNGHYIDPENWHCSAVKANTAGVFGSLEEVARALRSPINKDPEGKRLIRLFSVPDRKTGLFAQPRDNQEDFTKFGEYCKQDVRTEALVDRLVPEFSAEVQAEYEADQRINDRGFRHFKKLSEAAVAAVTKEQARMMGELRTLTGVENPNSIKQMRAWLERQGYPMRSLNKLSREEALRDALIPEPVAEALELKGAASLSSVAKHKTALSTRCKDGRIRGSLRFYGAHTGREAGRGIQPQNLPRYEAPLEDRVRLLRGGAGRDAPEIAKGSLRASIVPAKDHVFVGADYNAIEARCLGWLSGERWVNEEFQGQGKIYEATASMMFGVDKDKLIRALGSCGKCGNCADCEHRAKGKVSNLALGYGGGAGALVTMGAEEAGIDIGNYKELHREWEALGKRGKFHEWNRELHDYPELLRLRDLYRSASPATVRFWKLCAIAWDRAARGESFLFGENQVVGMLRDGRHNRLILPSGRSIWYRLARADLGKREPARVERRSFIGKSSRIGHARIETHGGKLTENVTQAVARDVLFDLIMRIEAMTKRGWPGRIVFHVHDEVVLEVPRRAADQVLADLTGLMATPPPWAKGLAVRGVGEIMDHYKK